MVTARRYFRESERDIAVFGDGNHYTERLPGAEVRSNRRHGSFCFDEQGVVDFFHQVSTRKF